MHAAENYLPRVGFGSEDRQLVGIAVEIGMADHIVALIVVAENDDVAAELFPGCLYALRDLLIGHCEVCFERTGGCQYFTHCTSFYRTEKWVLRQRQH